jgi:hypothetical protein
MGMPLKASAQERDIIAQTASKLKTGSTEGRPRKDL